MPAGNASAIAKPGSRLRELGLVLPAPPSPLGAYVEASQAGSLLFLSGTLPLRDRKLAISGRLGAGLSVEQGREAARLAALNALAAAEAHLGDQDDPLSVEQKKPSTLKGTMLTYRAYAAPAAKAPLQPLSFEPGPLGPEEVERNQSRILRSLPLGPLHAGSRTRLPARTPNLRAS